MRNREHQRPDQGLNVNQSYQPSIYASDLTSPPLSPTTITSSRSTPLPAGNGRLRKRPREYLGHLPDRSTSFGPGQSTPSSPTSPISPTSSIYHAFQPPVPPPIIPIQKEIIFSATKRPPLTPRFNSIDEPRMHQTFRYNAQPGNKLKSHTVGYADYGSSNADYPVFVIGGHGCTRLVGVMFAELAQRYGIRMIWPERPGYGLSDECNLQHISALAWADVVIQLADYLGIKQFGIIGQSVGSVFALAIAHKYPSRVFGPVFLISPWVSTQAANTFKWARRLPAAIVTRTASLAMDVMWMFNKGVSVSRDTTPRSTNPSSTSTSSNTSFDEGFCTGSEESPRTSEANRYGPKKGTDSPPPKTAQRKLTALEEDELLASLDECLEFTTDFPPHRPLRHVVRPKHVSLYLTMNKQRTAEPYSQGQLADVLVALEKYNQFGFNYSDIKTSVSAVWGDKDGLIPQRGIDVLANSLCDLRLKILEGEGHDLVWKEGVMEWAIRGISERR
ncbi:Alpha/Beta hydrolase protein [Phycomyces nitens]|nr:Alpha/Beta hydrolase protein [Phycomyces nitens]